MGTVVSMQLRLGIEVWDSNKLISNAADDDPKTSEYAFFKKLKEDASHRFHSHALHQDKNRSSNLKPNDCFRGRLKTVNMLIISKYNLWNIFMS